MSKRERYAYLIQLEAQRHLRLASIATTPEIRRSHVEVFMALTAATSLMREEVVTQWRIIPRSEIKRRLCLKPFTAD